MGERRFEYKFVRLNGGKKADYQAAVREHAEQGWRLIQILAPGGGGLGASANYVEVVFERGIEGQQH